MVGQQIAAMLGINYFDNANVSHHHVVRWNKKDVNALPFEGLNG